MGRHPSRRHTSPEEAPVGRQIRQRRRELGLTQAHLAGPEYTKSFISQLEGGYADPSLDTLRFLGRRLQMAVSTMAGDAEDQRLATAGGLLAWARERMHARDHASARRAIEVASDIAQASAWDLYIADASLLLAELELESGHLDRAAAGLDQVDSLAGRLGPRVQSRKDLMSGLLAMRRGDATGAVTVFRAVLGRVRKATRHPDLTARALLGLAAAASALGDLRQARRRLQSAITLTSRAQLDALHGRALVRLGVLCRLQGAGGEALTHLTSACQILERAGDPQALIEAEIRLGRLLLERGQAPEAIAPLRRVVELVHRHGDSQAEADALVLLGRAALAAGDPVLALRSADDAEALADALGATSMKSRAWSVKGRALLQQGRSADAVRLLTDAVAQLVDGGTADEAAEAATALGQFHRSRGEHDLAGRYLSAALAANRQSESGDGWVVTPVA
jgi:tetratricopeptide (TPR) repeat protein